MTVNKNPSERSEIAVQKRQTQIKLNSGCNKQKPSIQEFLNTTKVDLRASEGILSPRSNSLSLNDVDLRIDKANYDIVFEIE